jgi:tetratricopeptide (TPR) repeat protein
MIMAFIAPRLGLRSRFLAAGLLSILVPALMSVENSATDPYIDRQDSKFDTIYLRSGSPELGTNLQVDGEGNYSFDGVNGRRRVEKKEVLRIEPHRTVEAVVQKRGDQALARGDIEDALATMRWGRDKKSPEAAIKLAEKAIEKFPDHVVLTKLAIEFYKENNQAAKIESHARRLLKLDSHWSEGYEIITEILKADTAREADLRDWLNQWNTAQPTAFPPNKYLADMYEKTGDYKLAQEAFRKCWTLHKDLESGIGYARVSLKRGDTTKAMDAAKTLIADPKYADEAKAIMGSVKLAMGQLEEAETFLKEALGGTLSAYSTQYATYNLGYIQLRNNKVGEARELWKKLTTPVADLALACLERRSFDQVDSLPSPELKQLAKELNAAVALEQGQFAVAAALDPNASKRSGFLTQVAKVLQSVGSVQSVRELSLVNTPESLRWQAYGHMLAGRYRECETVLDALPENDGYALAYRLLIADARKDQNKALDYYKKIAASPNVPREWLAKAAATFEAANDEFKDEQFDWPEGDTLQTGWQTNTPGTGIHIHAKEGKLWFDGRQAVSADPVSHAFVMVRQDRLRQVKLTLDLSGIATATGGLEVLDESRTQGVQLAVRGDSRLAWRAVKGVGAYGKWEPIDLQIQGTTVTLAIDYKNGRVMAFMPADSSKKYPLGEASIDQTANLSIGIFGEAEAGVDWKLAADSMQVQLKPVGAPADVNGRFGQ